MLIVRPEIRDKPPQMGEQEALNFTIFRNGGIISAKIETGQWRNCLLGTSGAKFCCLMHAAFMNRRARFAKPQLTNSKVARSRH